MMTPEGLEATLTYASGRAEGGREIELVKVRLVYEVARQLRVANLIALASALDTRGGVNAGRSASSFPLINEARSLLVEHEDPSPA